MDSLYGGKPGAAFVIKASFPSIADMAAAFKQGPDYKDVWYGEHCIIDTPNKNDIDNGKIYQRGADFSSVDGNAIYVGQIVGPQSGTPYYSIKSIADIESIVETDLDTSVYEQRAYPYLDGDAEKVWIDDSNDGVDKDIATLSLSAAGETPSLVSGKDQDDIKYTWVNISKPHSDGYPTWTYVGFQIPYTVVEFTATSISPYNGDGSYAPQPTVDENDASLGHPFWYSYNLGLPKGVKGDTFRNIRVIALSEEHRGKIYQMQDFVVKSDGTVQVGTPSYSIPTDVNTVERKIYTVDFYFYDAEQNPASYQIYIGEYNQADGVELLDDGTLTFSFTYDDDKVFDKKLKWIESMSLSIDGKLVVEYNNGSSDYTTTISWIDNIVIDDANGDIKVHWCDKPEEEYTVLSSKLKLITDAYITSDGVITFQTNIQGDNITVLDAESHNAFKLKYPVDITLSDDADIEGDKRIRVDWNGSNGSVYIGDNINYIVDMRVNPSNWHLLVLFNDPKHRVNLTDASAAGIGNSNEIVVNGKTWVRRVATIDGIVTEANKDSVFWLDLGAIKDQSGVLIGGNVSLSTIQGTNPDIPTTDEIVQYLNSNYPTGRTDSKIITVGDNSSSVGKSFFAFDYNSKSWYYLGAISDISARSAALVSSNAAQSEYSDVVPRGLVFKTADKEYSVAPTKFWSLTSASAG